MGWLPEKTYSPIGLDIGRRCVKAVQLMRAKTGWRIAAAAVLERKTEDALLNAEEAERLCDVLHRQGFRGGDVVIAAPGRALRAEVLELPPRKLGSAAGTDCTERAGADGQARGRGV